MIDLIDLNDNDCVKEIREFVRQNPDIRVHEYIKRGLNGDVYFGTRKKMGDEVVLKFYWANQNYDASEEAVILKSIKHDNILEIYDLRFLPPHFAYFLTPKISGGDLQGILDERKLSSKETLEIISGILMGLTELHSKHNLVHRDLKPGNILINISDKRPIIADLGAVKKIENSNGSVTASKSTYYYLPPEAIEKDEYYFQSDIYQVGLILFQLLNGFFPINEPYKWMNKKEMKHLDSVKVYYYKEIEFNKLIGIKIRKGNIADTSTLPYYLDLGFKKVLNKALNYDYEKRYLNTSFFLKDIHQLQRNCPDYCVENDKLFITHDNGKKYQVYTNNKKQLVLERYSKIGWRKDNGHDGTLESIMSIARKN